MFEWWSNMESVAMLNGWMQILATASAAVTVICIFVLWIKGGLMVAHLIERERKANLRIKAVEKAAEQIRKELLATQQNQDIADQKLRLAEMDSDALRKEIEKLRNRYQDAEVALKNRIEELKDMNITQTTGTTHSPAVAPKPRGLDNQQQKMLVKLLKDGPKGELDIISVLDNPHSQEIASVLKASFDEEGWSTSNIIQSAFSNPPEGLVLVIHSKQTAPSYSKFLQRTFTTIGIPVIAQINNKFREWSISLIVGNLE